MKEKIKNSPSINYCCFRSFYIWLFFFFFNLISKAIKITTEIIHNFPDGFHHIFTVLSLYCSAKGICLQGCCPVLKASIQNAFLPVEQRPRNSYNSLYHTVPDSKRCSDHFAPALESLPNINIGHSQLHGACSKDRKRPAIYE